LFILCGLLVLLSVKGYGSGSVGKSQYVHGCSCFGAQPA
jgi:hypothetical protein